MTLPKTYYAYEHQKKEYAFSKALVSAGFSKIDKQTSSIILVDVDSPSRVTYLHDRAVRGSANVFTYPHAARPNLFWDGFIEPWKHTRGSFVFAKGHKEVLEAYGYPNPVHICGWSYSRIEDFKPKSKIKKILFAPIHPTRAGYLPDEDKLINAETFRKLLAYCKGSDAKLTVRHVDAIEKNGIWREDSVEYVCGNINIGSQEAQILESDLVIAHQTFLWISVALGVPSLAMSEQTAPKFGKDEKHLQRVASWDKYKHLICYPFDILDCPNVSDLIEKVRLHNPVEWKEKMIGDLFDEKKVSDVVLQYL